MKSMMICYKKIQLFGYKHYVLMISPYNFPCFFYFIEQESPKEHPTEMCPSTSPRTSPPRRTSKHPQTRCRTVQQSSTPRLQSQALICHKCRSQKDTRNQGRTWLCTG